MDLQLPILSGIEASQTIRKLEGIKQKLYYKEQLTEEEEQLIQKYPINMDHMKIDSTRSFIPCIIVALTASNTLQDKNQAINSGCNDYLTKPVNLVWLSNKLMEWGYMQSLMNKN